MTVQKEVGAWSVSFNDVALHRMKRTERRLVRGTHSAVRHVKMSYEVRTRLFARNSLAQMWARPKMIDIARTFEAFRVKSRDMLRFLCPIYKFFSVFL
jgi:hypothetical protein